MSGINRISIFSARIEVEIFAMRCLPPQCIKSASEYFPSVCLIKFSTIEYILQSESLSHNTTTLWNKLDIMFEYLSNGSFQTSSNFSLLRIEKAFVSSFRVILTIFYTLRTSFQQSFNDFFAVCGNKCLLIICQCLPDNLSHNSSLRWMEK